LVKVIIGFVLLVIIALFGYRRTFTKVHIPLGARYIYLTGTEFILVGVALGGQFIGVLDAPALRSLTPLYSLCLGFMGLIFGIQLEFNKLKRLPWRYDLIVVIQALVTMAVVFFPCWILMKYVFGTEGHPQVLGAFVLAATASCTGLTTLALLSRDLKLRKTPFIELLQYISSLDAIVGLVGVGIAFSLMHTHSPFGSHAGAGILAVGISFAIGLTTGFLLHLITQHHCSEEELGVFIIGMVLFAAGLAEYFMLSPLFVCLVTGIVMANVKGAKDRVFYLLARLEHPFYLIMLILAGAIWNVATPWAWVFAALYLGLRFAGKVMGGYLAVRSVGAHIRAPGRLGLGLMSQGGMAVAMVINFNQIHPTEYSGLVVTAVLSAVIVNELISPTLIRSVLLRTGEVKP